VQTATNKIMPGQRYAGAVTTKARRYRDVPEKAVKTIRACAAIYGSQANALLVGTEILIRLKKRIRVKRSKKPKTVDAPFKLSKRTIDLIDRLTPIYGSHGEVLSACSEIVRKPV
jgi:hypothetical protein